MSPRGVERTGRRRLAAALLALPLAVATAVVSSTATASSADAGRIQISDSKLTSTSQEVTIRVRLGALEKGKLGLTPPGGTEPVQVAKGTGPKMLSYTLSLSCPTYDGSCVEDGRQVPARNGRWRVTFGAKVLVLGSGSESSFVVDAPPEKPSGVAAAAPSAKNVQVRWQKGAEPDLESYRVAVGGKTKRVSSGSCGGSCSTVLAAPAGGGSTPVEVVAVRDGYGGKRSSPPTRTNADVPQGSSSSRATGGSGADGPEPTRKARSGSAGGFPSPRLGETGAAKSSGEGWPQGLVPTDEDPYPSFGAQPRVAPAESPRRDSAQDRAVEPLSYGQARGDAAVPVAMALVLVLASSHTWMWSRRHRLRSAISAGLHRATGRRRRGR